LKITLFNKSLKLYHEYYSKKDYINSLIQLNAILSISDINLNLNIDQHHFDRMKLFFLLKRYLESQNEYNFLKIFFDNDKEFQKRVVEFKNKCDEHIKKMNNMDQIIKKYKIKYKFKWNEPKEYKQCILLLNFLIRLYTTSS
jgi:hypothetical protein